MWQPSDVVIDDMARLTGRDRETVIEAVIETYHQLRDQGWTSQLPITGIVLSEESLTERDLEYIYETIYVEMVAAKFDHLIANEDQRHALKTYAWRGFNMKGIKFGGISHLLALTSNELFIPYDDYEPKVGGQFRVMSKNCRRSDWYTVVAADRDSLYAIPSFREWSDSSWSDHMSMWYVINDRLATSTLRQHKAMSQEEGEPVWVFDYDLKKRSRQRIEFPIWGP